MMFRVSITLGKANKRERVFYQCPRCLTKSVYFFLAPGKCESCGELLPDPEKMEISERARLNYYISDRGVR